MEIHEHTQKDFQIATQVLLMEQGALLRSILQNQMIILKMLSEDKRSFHKDVNDLVTQNREYMESVMKSLPNYSDVQPALKDPPY